VIFPVFLLIVSLPGGFWLGSGLFPRLNHSMHL
jgi:hypothetical protein